MKRLSILFLAIVAVTAVWAGGPKKIKIDPAVLDSLRNANALLMQKVEMLTEQLESYKSLAETMKSQVEADNTTIAGLKEQNQQLTKQLADLKEAEPANINTDGNVFGGGCGADLRWKFTASTGTLEISGTGAMGDYDCANNNYAPWYSYSSNIWKVILNDGITKIGIFAFYNCEKFSSIEIPSSVKEIGQQAFSGCSGLKSLTIPSSVKEIGGGAFWDCTGLTSLTIPSSVKVIGGNAFSGCSGLTSIIVESGNPNYDSRNGCNAIIEKASSKLINGCKATKIPSSVKEIGVCAFSGCTGLTSLTIPSSVKVIGSHAFSGCSGLKSLTIPSSVKEIEELVFCNCTGLTSLTIPSSVTKIGWGAFMGCTSLTSLTIPSSVKEIGGGAFRDCTKLRIKVPRSAKYNKGYNGIDGGYAERCHSFYSCASVTYY